MTAITSMNAMTFDRSTALGYLVHRLAKQFARALERTLGRHGVAPGHFKIMMVLWEEDGLSQSEVARRLEIEQPTVANTVRRMIRAGLVTMDTDPLDGRRVTIRLTQRSRSLYPVLAAEAEELNREAARALAGGELGIFQDCVSRMTDVLERRADEI